MSEMQSDTAVVAEDIQSSDDTAELSETEVAAGDSDPVIETCTGEVQDIGSGTAGNITIEDTAHARVVATEDTADAGTGPANSHEPDGTTTQQLSSSAGVATDSAAAIDVSAADQPAASTSDNTDDAATSLPTSASRPSSCTSSVS